MGFLDFRFVIWLQNKSKRKKVYDVSAGFTENPPFSKHMVKQSNEIGSLQLGPCMRKYQSQSHFQLLFDKAINN